ncbi:flagellar assembly peptidoglycan hydrolase FlgJ [Burkholderia sp. L27(2015)]|uniref:flagellar assembly peptidoglycan hydrolase FlgJ n=1 Tax=Burkholderia sp. L27(2015) TaxID=1641858 RepID=UPI00131D3FD2|nr:flagellar assembly peptidoglycan hydrolase FlgJ [Burkholderia sp. L27(2015)]
MSAPDDFNQRFAFDMQGFNALRQDAKVSPEQGARIAAKQFDVMFTQMMLKSMREATPSDGMLDSHESQTYTDMLDQQLSQSLSSKGIGLANQMLGQLMRAQGASTAGAGANATALKAYSNSATNGSLSKASGFDAASVDADDTLAHAEGATNAQAFVSKLASSAQAASSTTGIPARYILGQAALESGWGKKEIRHQDGSTTHNVFGVKAGKSWTGPTVLAKTTEYIGGVAHHVVARFRAYGSYDEAVADYASLLKNNPRYAAVVSASRDPASFAQGLQNAGYATDPLYAKKLMSVMKQV